MASGKHRRTLVSRKFIIPVILHKPKGHKRIILKSLSIHLGHEPYAPIHRTPGHDSMGGSRAPPEA